MTKGLTLKLDTGPQISTFHSCGYASDLGIVRDDVKDVVEDIEKGERKC